MADQNSPSNVTDAFRLAMSLGGGVIPESGNYTAEVWGLMLGVTAIVFRSYVKKYDIPYREPGNTMFVDARDLLDSVPLKRKGRVGG